MSGMRLLALGVGDAFSARYYSSCLAVEAEGRWLLLDCPHPIRKILREGSGDLGLDIPNLQGVVVTHLHADHASGLETVGFFGRFVLGRRLPLLAHADVLADVWDRCLAGSMEWSLQKPGEPPEHRTLADYFEAQALPEGEPLAFGPFTIHCRRTIHNIPTFAIRVEAGGRSLGYSSDTAFDPALVDWLAGADFVVHEACGGFMHTPSADLEGLPESLRRKLRIIHYPDALDPRESALEPLEQGRLYDV